MNYETLERFRRKLYLRRMSLTERRQHALAAEGQLLEEREPDWTDAAAAETAAELLDSLGETNRLELARIQASLGRMAEGTYGECVACGGAIDEERLYAVPETDRCGRCASAH